MTREIEMNALGQAAKQASAQIRLADGDRRNAALQHMADEIRQAEPAIIKANAADMEAARDKGISDAMLDRLKLNPARVEAIAKGLESIAKLPDPVGSVDKSWTQPNGLNFSQVRVPIGVIGMIYESRPNVTADAGGLCVKSGNACVLRGGSIPRGGKGLVARVQEDARVPVLAHLEGLNHSYLHADANIDQAINIIENAKLRRTGICGATETLLVDTKIASMALPALAAKIGDRCELRGDARVRAILPDVTAASDADFATEHLAAILNVAIVDGMNSALDHISKYGSGHTDAILTENMDAAEIFLNSVDSAIVLHNASTQYADGGEFGFGAEIGIATGRLHARGPVGAQHLTTYKYQIRGNGQVRP